MCGSDSRRGRAKGEQRVAEQAAQERGSAICAAERNARDVAQTLARDAIEVRPPERSLAVRSLHPRDVRGVGVLDPGRGLSVGRDTKHPVADDGDHPKESRFVERERNWSSNNTVYAPVDQRLTGKAA